MCAEKDKLIAVMERLQEEKERFWADVYCAAINGDVLIVAKDGRYRVTVTKFESKNPPYTFLWADMLQSDGSWNSYKKKNSRRTMQRSSIYSQLRSRQRRCGKSVPQSVHHKK